MQDDNGSDGGPVKPAEHVTCAFCEGAAPRCFVICDGCIEKGRVAMQPTEHEQAAHDSLPNAQRRSQFWKDEKLAADAEIESLRQQLAAARAEGARAERERVLAMLDECEGDIDFLRFKLRAAQAEHGGEGER